MGESEEAIKTIEFRAQMLAEIKELHHCIDNLTESFKEFKAGIGQRTENHQDRITILETSLAVMAKVMWWIVGTAGVAIATAIFKMILK